MPQPLILASASPRRRELLTQIGYAFTVETADVDETRHAAESPLLYVARLAQLKAATVLARHDAAGALPPLTVLAADTTVELAGDVLNKPRDAADAHAMLRRLSGRTHLVHTAVHLLQHGLSLHHVETTRVTFAAIPDADLARYVASGDPLDKAGAYGIQGFAARWIPAIEGDYFNVVGLPLHATALLLARAGL